MQSVERAFALLEAFAPPNKEMGISELSQKLSLPRPTVSRMVATLEGLGYVSQNKDTKKYSLGLKLLHLGAMVQDRFQLKDIAAPVLHELRDQLKETVYINVIDGDERVCIYSLPGLYATRSFVEVGQRSPLYAGADSRMLLASLSGSEFETYLGRTKYRQFTPKTIINPEELRKVVEESKESGYALSVSEYNMGSACISAPIRYENGKIVAVVSVSFSELKVSLPCVETYKTAVIGAAHQISSLISFSCK